MSRTPSRITPGASHPPAGSGRRQIARVAVGALVLGTVIFASAPSASAHVHVDASTTEPAAFSILTFRVPTESATASTTSVEVTLPSDKPFPSVSAKAVAGWTVQVSEAKLPTPVVDDDGATLTKAPHTVTWTARTGSAIGPGQFGEFELQVGPLPQSGTVVLPVTQTYSDASVVRWDEPTAGDGEEPEHPAPAIDVASVPDATSSGAAPTSSDGAARVLGVVGIAIGTVGAGMGLVGLVSARRRASA